MKTCPFYHKELKMRYRWFLPLVLAVTLTHCSKKNSTNLEVVTVEDLMVKNNEISGWNRAGEGWVASSESSLYERIDGMAPPYVSHGYVEAADQNYKGKVLQDTVTVDLMVFDQGNSSNAQALFGEISSRLLSPEIWETQYFQEAKIERLPTLITILAWKSKYYLSLSITSNTSESFEVVKTFATNVGSKIK
jgi:hypothetical protein